ncbi:MAG: S-adenosylmethionine decarboxylase, partial [Atribacterota bacterium]|nr:S-adenosylmethionine decarboxylase [Atribacterota bacterium]
NIKKEFYNTKAWGLSTSVDLYGCNPETIRDARAIKRYVDELCELIEMKQFGETKIVNFGEDEKVAGFSMVQLIETSLISGHFANMTNNAYIDIFSCKYYEPSTAVEFTEKFFEAKEVKMHCILRTN